MQRLREMERKAETMKRSFLAGFVTALLVCAMVGSAYASTGKVTQELEYRNIKISLDGQTLSLRDSGGKPVEPFLFGGTTYLPVEPLAEAMGMAVSWDAASSTVQLFSGEQEAQLQALGFSEADPSEVAETADAGRGQTVASYLADTSAKMIALDHAGVKESAASNMQITLDNSGAGEYKVQFSNGGAAYSYVIDALSGEVISFARTSK